MPKTENLIPELDDAELARVSGGCQNCASPNARGAGHVPGSRSGSGTGGGGRNGTGGGRGQNR